MKKTIITTVVLALFCLTTYAQFEKEFEHLKQDTSALPHWIAVYAQEGFDTTQMIVGIPETYVLNRVFNKEYSGLMSRLLAPPVEPGSVYEKSEEVDPAPTTIAAMDDYFLKGEKNIRVSRKLLETILLRFKMDHIRPVLIMNPLDAGCYRVDVIYIRLTMSGIFEVVPKLTDWDISCQ